MSLFDDGLPNIKTKTLGGNVFWTTLDEEGGYRLQRNDVFGNCRILDDDDCRVAWGDEGMMRAKFRSLTAKVSLRFGDVIGVHRGLYDHYGVYENDSCVYEYAADRSDFGNAVIRTSTLKKFIGDSGNCFVLNFPERYDRPRKLNIPVDTGSGLFGGMGEIAKAIKLFKSAKYHLYSPEETIQRARSRLGENEYNLAFNNCEHFAIWCKTGISESHQVNDLLDVLLSQIG